MSNEVVTVGSVLTSWFATLRRHGAVCALAGGLIAVLGVLIDLTLGEKGGQLALSFASFFVQYHLVEYVLNRDFGTPVGGRHYGSAFGAAFLSTLGAGGAMLLLIVPGLYVAARWSLSDALVIGEGLGAIESLRESWRRTADAAWTIVISYVLIGLAFVGGLLLLGLIAELTKQAVAETTIASVGGNAFGGFISVVISLLACSLYGLIGNATAALDDVFG
ncbi:hypothetical protein [Novosphingobium sp. FKTRR1]|uniref:hypothetical protein n=1 Tax=Novosphingobium sp. FKTRR1 TaxID=2879118 RepID=UPI001CF021CB|nr:hypothetical protein [Novosphingobium sp. FKTRR1]